MRASHVLNINSGTVCPRTIACDDHPMILRPIDEETAVAIMTGKVKASDVIKAITKAEMSAEDFDWPEYDRKRRAAEEHYNVSKREMIPVSEEEQEASQKQDENIVSFKDLGISAEGKKPAAKGENPAQKTAQNKDQKKGEVASGNAVNDDSELKELFGK